MIKLWHEHTRKLNQRCSLSLKSKNIYQNRTCNGGLQIGNHKLTQYFILNNIFSISYI